MKVNVTLDYYDGSASKAKTIEAETLPVHELMFKMMGSDVCGFTVTKLPTVKKLMEKMNG